MLIMMIIIIMVPLLMMSKTIFATLSTVITVDKQETLLKICFFSKDLEIEDMDMRHNIMYAAVNIIIRFFIYSMLNY